jgi:hypothetical protein
VHSCCWSTLHVPELSWLGCGVAGDCVWYELGKRQWPSCVGIVLKWCHARRHQEQLSLQGRWESDTLGSFFVCEYGSSAFAKLVLIASC